MSRLIQRFSIMAGVDMPWYQRSAPTGCRGHGLRPNSRQRLAPLSAS
jgi:hypothetical protein